MANLLLCYPKGEIINITRSRNEKWYNGLGDVDNLSWNIISHKITHHAVCDESLSIWEANLSDYQSNK